MIRNIIALAATALLLWATATITLRSPAHLVIHGAGKIYLRATCDSVGQCHLWEI